MRPMVGCAQSCRAESVMPSSKEDPKPSSRRAASGSTQGMAPALDWMADRLAELLVPPAEPTLEQLEQSEKQLKKLRSDMNWGPDAAQSMTEYWHWKHLCHLDRIDADTADP